MNDIANQAVVDAAIMRPFHVNVSEADLTDLRRRIEATRWPEEETVADTSQGVPLVPLQNLVRHWATDYDWRKCEAKLNALPQSPRQQTRTPMGKSMPPRTEMRRSATPPT